MKFLSIAGTAAMFLVGGGILLHGLPGSHDVLHHLDDAMASLPLSGMLSVVVPMLANLVLGIVAGSVLLLLVTGAGKLRKK